MIKKSSLVGAVLVSLLLPVSVSAATLTKSECEAMGGTYSNDQGTKTCILPVSETDPSGNSGNAWTVEGQQSTEQQGTIGAQGTSDTLEQLTTTTSCSNPGGHEMKLTSSKCEL